MAHSLDISCFFNQTANTQIYTLSLHDALPIFEHEFGCIEQGPHQVFRCSASRHLLLRKQLATPRDRKSTRLNSSHGYISYAVFCLKKKIDTLPPHDVQSYVNAVRIGQYFFTIE